MNEKYIQHTVENLIEFANDLIFIDTTKNDYLKAINALKTAELLLAFYDNNLYKLEEKVVDLKFKIGQILLNEMVSDCKETVQELIEVRFE